MLMKFIDKLFSAEPASWKNWLLHDAATFDTPLSGHQSYLWKIIIDELNTFHSITYVRVHSGSATSFWFDHWLPDGLLCSSHPALFSHTTRPNISVQSVFRNGFDLCLRPRLTTAASAQLDSLLSYLQEFQLDDSPDVRLMKLTGKPYSARDAYKAIVRVQDIPDPHGRSIWGDTCAQQSQGVCLIIFQRQT